MRRTVLAAAMLASTSMLVHAQSNLEKLSNFKTTGTKEFTVIEQGGDKADAIKAILEKIKLPDGFSIGPDVAAFNVLKQGDLIPEDEVSYNHTARVCRIGPDGKLYVSLGQPFNVPAPEKAELYGEHGIGGIIRINQDGTGREVYARGVRNSVGHDFNPANGDSGSPITRSTAWATIRRPARSTARPRRASISAFRGMAAGRCARSNTRTPSRPRTR